jgi:hypothetical protein
VTAFTDSKRDPSISVTAICEKGIISTPVGLYLGQIPAVSATPLNQVITLQRREGAFKITKVTCEDPLLEIVPETLVEGSQYRLKVTYKGGWPAGLVQRNIVVETDDPRQPQIKIGVLANVMDGKGAVPGG